MIKMGLMHVKTHLDIGINIFVMMDNFQDKFACGSILYLAEEEHDVSLKKGNIKSNIILCFEETLLTSQFFTSVRFKPSNFDYCLIVAVNGILSLQSSELNELKLGLTESLRSHKKVEHH
jgi:hypothetical protein